MGDVATPHVTRPNRVMITEALTPDNRGPITRWLEDRGISVALPADITDAVGIIVDRRHCIGAHEIVYGDRLVHDGRRVQAVDHAHYKLWYEPAAGSPDGRTEP